MMISDFSKTLETLVAVEIAQCKLNNDSDRLSNCLHKLCDAIAVAIAMASNGDPDDTKEAISIATETITTIAVKCTQMAQLVLAQPMPGAKLS
jgi:hypothetical protein